MLERRGLLSLLRFSIVGGCVADVVKDCPDIDWRVVYSLALHQGVAAILLDVVGGLPVEQRPPKSVLLPWIGQVALMEKMYAMHRNQISSLARFYGRHGIRMLLLKGYGCSQCYPHPEHRPTGDVDVFLFGKKEEADRRFREFCAFIRSRELEQERRLDVFRVIEVAIHYTGFTLPEGG